MDGTNMDGGIGFQGMPLEMAEKIAATNEFTDLQSTPAGKIVLNLINVLIDEVRRNNDNAEADQVIHNQGKIAGFKQIKGYLTHSLPASKK
jgi:hypothetical protein